jgi:sugar phosphate isomerase/epimerase
MFPKIEISVAMVGLTGEGDRAASRQVIERLGGMSTLGVRGVQIDGTRAGLRARELDRSARRDLAAMLRRLQIACSGLDVFVPSEHFASAATVDRAVASVVGAIELAAELRTLGAGGETSVSVVLPKDAGADVLRAIESAGEREGVRVADCAWRMRETESAVIGAVVGVGIDPAAVLSAGESPAKLAARLGVRVVSARLSDVVKGVGAVRCAPGAKDGTLEMAAYHATLGVIGYRGMAVLDLRGVLDPAARIRGVVERWGGGPA